MHKGKKPALCFFSAVLPLLDHSLRALSDQINLLINNKWTNSQLGAAIFFVEFHHSKIMGLAYCDWLKRRRRRRSFSFINHTLKIKMESKLFRYHEMFAEIQSFAKKMQNETETKISKWLRLCRSNGEILKIRNFSRFILFCLFLDISKICSSFLSLYLWTLNSLFDKKIQQNQKFQIDRVTWMNHPWTKRARNTHARTQSIVMKQLFVRHRTNFWDEGFVPCAWKMWFKEILVKEKSFARNCLRFCMFEFGPVSQIDWIANIVSNMVGFGSRSTWNRKSLNLPSTTMIILMMMTETQKAKRKRETFAETVSVEL